MAQKKHDTSKECVKFAEVGDSIYGIYLRTELQVELPEGSVDMLKVQQEDGKILSVVIKPGMGDVVFNFTENEFVEIIFTGEIESKRAGRNAMKTFDVFTGKKELDKKGERILA
tara:strand:- start:12929 stop:13270 length:342 start_codon:yes stop_codon:yes gene_type:complete